MGKDLPEALKHYQYDAEKQELATHWFKQNIPQWVSTESHADILSPQETQHFAEFDMFPLLVSGVQDISNKMASYFFFTGCQFDSEKAKYLITLISPFIHTILLRWAHYNSERVNDVPLCTTSEKEVIYNVFQGFSNKQIARNLGKSPYTVRNQLIAIYEKFNVSSRSELISVLEKLQ